MQANAQKDAAVILKQAAMEMAGEPNAIKLQWCRASCAYQTSTHITYSNFMSIYSKFITILTQIIKKNDFFFALYGTWEALDSTKMMAYS